MDDADRVCRLPDDEWQDYDISYASEIKKKSEALLLSYACINCDTMLCLIDQQMEDLPLRKSDESRVVDGLYNANKFQNFKIEGVGPDGKPAEAQRAGLSCYTNFRITHTTHDFYPVLTLTRQITQVRKSQI